jgi:hypothetical protein
MRKGSHWRRRVPFIAEQRNGPYKATNRQVLELANENSVPSSLDAHGHQGPSLPIKRLTA